MSHSVAFVLCMAGFTALALATRRQQRDIIGRSLQLAATRLLRIAGVGGLLVALGILVDAYGWSLAVVMFSGHTGIAAGIVYCGLVLYARWQSRPLRHG